MKSQDISDTRPVLPDGLAGGSAPDDREASRDRTQCEARDARAEPPPNWPRIFPSL